MIKDDGDIIKGLGYVTLYSAYLEEQIDQLLFCLHPFVVAFDEEKQRWPVSKKIKHAIKNIDKLDFERRNDLKEDLNICRQLFENRNELIHGRIYADIDSSNITLKPGRPNTPEKFITSTELFTLANELFNIASEIARPMIFDIPRAIKEKYLNNLTQDKKRV